MQSLSCLTCGFQCDMLILVCVWFKLWVGVLMPCGSPSHFAATRAARCCCVCVCRVAFMSVRFLCVSFHGVFDLYHIVLRLLWLSLS